MWFDEGMKVEEAIKKAIEGGYPFWGKTNARAFEGVDTNDHLSDILLDPSFWQSLGKAIGWGKTKNFESRREDSLLDLWPEEWQVYWHIFIDHLAGGKTVEEFFESLRN